MDALDLLEQQHRDVAEIIDRIIVESGTGTRTSLVAELVRSIEAHSRVEERYFYAAVRARVGEEPRLYEAFEDHALLRFAAVNLLRTRATDARFEARLKLVQQLHARHAAGEEDWVFPKAKRNISDEDLDAVGIAVARAYGVLMDAAAFGPARPRPLSGGRRAQGMRPRRPLRARVGNALKKAAAHFG